MEYTGKKLLIIGGAEVHCKVVRAAKEMGIYTIVADYLPIKDSPAKRIADKSYEIDIYDTDGLIRIARENQVDGVINTSLDPCQIPQSKVCEALNLFCYGTPDQYYQLTNKLAFKELCRKNGVDTIEDYTEEDLRQGRVKYPLFIKPVDSRGSRGQSICNDYAEAIKGLEVAKSISTDGKAVIEQYLKDKQDFMLSYIVVQGEAHLVRSCDRYEGKFEDGLDKVGALAMNPSKYSKKYFELVHPRVVKMIENLGIQNGPVFLQGFFDEDTVRMYDPGLRLPGGNYENLFKACTGIDIIKKLIAFSITGKIPDEYGTFSSTDCFLNGNYVSNLFPMIGPGIISEIQGMEHIQKQDYIVSAALRHNIGDEVQATHTVNQRIGEFNIKTASIDEMKKAILDIYEHLKVFDENGNDLSCSKLDIENLWIGEN